MDDSTSEKTSQTVTAIQWCGSVYGESRYGEDEAAVEVETKKRSKRKPRDIKPAQQKSQSKWRARNDADHVGNIGWLFGNWGKRP